MAAEADTDDPDRPGAGGPRGTTSSSAVFPLPLGADGDQSPGAPSPYGYEFAAGSRSFLEIAPEPSRTRLDSLLSMVSAPLRPVSRQSGVSGGAAPNQQNKAALKRIRIANNNPPSKVLCPSPSHPPCYTVYLPRIVAHPQTEDPSFPDEKTGQIIRRQDCT